MPAGKDWRYFASIDVTPGHGEHFLTLKRVRGVGRLIQTEVLELRALRIVVPRNSVEARMLADALAEAAHEWSEERAQGVLF